ncbi:MAG: hypothetical protein B6D77_10555 [gamma proteobacterium symbiont of Ctena orbiculata]|nr:MAG: hypothetical protein B6D77_10555 [gamma proteobacterium symbiont of Ctena orbiculata]PVV20590.1 MAG: hypothetical protein B6D78_10225 [gamma proteobacterium symbiont of Ctena orbiculata]PVV21547.1 MAG: hypothetical protein B6D79_13815 [gamma proteobacterium symbiont of Ctena orbiculata]
MYHTQHPEDSILKRHFDATVEMKRQMWLQTPPTDSILHRHAMSLSNHPSVRPGTAARNNAATTRARQVNEDKKGFLSWFFDLFRSA